MKLSEIITIIIAAGVLIAVFFLSRGEQKHDKEPLFDSNGALNQDFSVPSFSNLDSNNQFLSTKEEKLQNSQKSSFSKNLKKVAEQSIKESPYFTLGIYSVSQLLQGDTERCSVSDSSQEGTIFEYSNPEKITLDDVIIQHGEAFLFVQQEGEKIEPCGQTLKIPQFNNLFKSLYILFN